MSDNIVSVSHVYKAYNKKPALYDFSMDVKRGRIVGLLGINGSGKSTIIKILNGLIQADKGEVLIGDNHVSTETKKIVSYLPERTYLDKSATVKETLDFFADFYEDFDYEKAKSQLERHRIDLNSRISHLSKGMQEKTQLALVMSRKAELYILDEPIGGVDPLARDLILETIMTNFNEGASMIISTHLISDIEKILDDVVFIYNGQAVYKDTADNIRNTFHSSISDAFKTIFRDLEMKNGGIR